MKLLLSDREMIAVILDSCITFPICICWM